MESDAVLIFPHSVAQLSPLPPSYLLINGYLISCGPQIFVCDPLWPENAESLPETFVDEGL